MTDDFLKFDSDKFNIDDFQFDISSAIPENELLEFNPTAFTGVDNGQLQLNNGHGAQLDSHNANAIQTSAIKLENADTMRQNSISAGGLDPSASSFHNSFHNNSYISPINSPYTTGSHLSTSFQPQRKNSIYDTLESVSSPQQPHNGNYYNNNADAITNQYFSPPAANRNIPLSASRKSGGHLGPSSIQTFNTTHSLASPRSYNDAMSPYSSFNDFKSPRSMAASPAGPGGSSLPKQQLSKEEKLRRRREFHNQVERRRRDLIKEKIKELGLIVPPSLLYVDSDGKEVKASKSVIINKTVEYVVHLHKVMSEQEVRKNQLLKKIAELELLPDVNSATPISHGEGEQDATDESQLQSQQQRQQQQHQHQHMDGHTNFSGSNSNSYVNSPVGHIKFETEGADLGFDVNELLKEHSNEGWDAFNQ